MSTATEVPESHAVILANLFRASAVLTRAIGKPIAPGDEKGWIYRRMCGKIMSVSSRNSGILKTDAFWDALRKDTIARHEQLMPAADKRQFEVMIDQVHKPHRRKHYS